MKRSSMLTALATTTLAALTTTAAVAQNGMNMPGMQMSGAAGPQKAKLGHTTGRVVQIDTATSRITIAHHPVAALGWPAMTMTFQATSDQLQGITAGDQVDFQFYMRGQVAEIDRIHKIG